MREIRTSGSEGGAGSTPVPTPIVREKGGRPGVAEPVTVPMGRGLEYDDEYEHEYERVDPGAADGWVGRSSGTGDGSDPGGTGGRTERSPVPLVRHHIHEIRT